jgi:predicted 3-demethylubiquinone-9 3-methyltransferase (glyoxalase superfamily)
MYGWFDMDRLNGKSVRGAVVALLTNTANQHRAIATAIERMIESRPDDLMTQRVTQTLWFDGNAGAAVNFYLSVFKDAGKDPNVAQYRDILPGARSAVSGVKFAIEGQQFIAFDRDSQVKEGTANLLTLNCDTQEEIDYYWEKLSTGGEKLRSGWLKDRFGVLWHVVPSDLPLLIGGKDPSMKTQKVIDAMQKMGKLDAAALRQACWQD